MKRNNLQSIVYTGVLTLLMMSCENQDVRFPDYGKTTVYFPYQYPVRTIVMGEDIFDTSLDNQRRCEIYATMGGVYDNNKRIDIGISVDNTLCNNLFFDADYEIPVQPMPSNYYTLSSEQISLDGSLQGGVGVQLTDAFFADRKALQNTYVIPLKMTEVTNADAILAGESLVDEPNRLNGAHWKTQPKDFVLYCVKFINPWHANYLRRGKDDITVDGVASSVTRHKPNVEDDEIRKLNTLGLNDVIYPMDYKSQAGQNLKFSLRLAFDEAQKCSVGPDSLAYKVSDSVRVYNITASGNGAFVKKGEKNSWGNKDRDALYLKYNVSYEVETNYPKAGFPTKIEQVMYATTDTLVVRDRGVSAEIFTPVLKP